MNKMGATMTSSEAYPLRIDLKKEERLLIEWDDGQVSIYPIGYLRLMCPCAACKLSRTGTDPHSLMQPQKKTVSLNILPVDRSGKMAATHAQLIGGYALKIGFTDRHEAGIYSFSYLREISPEHSTRANQDS